jgi:hypothetical protein
LKRKAQAVSQKGKGEKHTAEGTRKVEWVFIYIILILKHIIMVY